MARSETYARIEKALCYVDDHREEQPGLEEIAKHVGLSPYHFQKLFSRWVGISPKRFLQFLTVDHARQCLEESRSVLDATYDSGLSSPGRLHDLFVGIDAMTPGEYKRRGEGLEIRYGVHPSPFGACLVGATDRGVCWLSFHDDANSEDGIRDLRRTWERASFSHIPEETSAWCERIFAEKGTAEKKTLPLMIRGTNFQIKVWEALIRVPRGTLCSYQDVARWIGQPTATRAVGSAVAANPIAYLIPCHRVIRAMGSFGDYRWGATRKQAMIGWEMAVRQSEAAI